VLPGAGYVNAGRNSGASVMDDKEIISKYFADIGRKGGESCSDRKVAAVQQNGLSGGRPRRYPPCPRYAPPRYNGHHRFGHGKMHDRCPCGYVRPATYVRPARYDYKHTMNGRIKGLAAVEKPVKHKPQAPGEVQAPGQAAALTGEYIRVGNQLIIRR